MIDREEAAGALDMVARSRRLATELRSYASGGEVLIGWGIAWLACNMVAQLDPPWAGVAWMVGVPFGVGWTMVRAREKADARVLGTVAAALGFVVLAALITGASERAYAALVSLLVAMSYVVLGLWTGMRFALLGLLLAASVVLGWFVFPAFLYLFLAIGGGGSLIAGGIWLRRA